MTQFVVNVTFLVEAENAETAVKKVTPDIRAFNPAILTWDHTVEPA